jgi:hypothetical protein
MTPRGSMHKQSDCASFRLSDTILCIADYERPTYADYFFADLTLAHRALAAARILAIPAAEILRFDRALLSVF